MATLTIRGLDDRVRERLRVRAANHGRSMEAEARLILADAVSGPAARAGLGTRIHRRFKRAGGFDIEIPERTEPPRLADIPR
jgi:plasmid stability protein